MARPARAGPRAAPSGHASEGRRRQGDQGSQGLRSDLIGQQEDSCRHRRRGREAHPDPLGGEDGAGSEERERDEGLIAERQGGAGEERDRHRQGEATEPRLFGHGEGRQRGGGFPARSGRADQGRSRHDETRRPARDHETGGGETGEQRGADDREGQRGGVRLEQLRRREERREREREQRERGGTERETLRPQRLRGGESHASGEHQGHGRAALRAGGQQPGGEVHAERGEGDLARGGGQRQRRREQHRGGGEREKERLGASGRVDEGAGEGGERQSAGERDRGAGEGRGMKGRETRQEARQGGRRGEPPSYPLRCGRRRSPRRSTLRWVRPSLTRVPLGPIGLTLSRRRG